MEFKKHDSGKPPLHYLGQFRGPLGEVAHLLHHGAQKYGDNKNWQKCADVTRYHDAAARHLFAAMDGEHDDPDSKRPHLAAVIVNCMFALGLEETQGKPE